jgi:hypothetical protein
MCTKMAYKKQISKILKISSIRHVRIDVGHVGRLLATAGTLRLHNSIALSHQGVSTRTHLKV